MRGPKPARGPAAVLLFRFLALLLLWLPLVFLSIEALYRFRLHHIGSRNEHVVEGRQQLLGFAAALDSTLWEKPFYSYRPSHSIERTVLGREFEFRTDALGFRNDPIEHPKPDSIYRIVCVGGSTTVSGWTNESTYPSRLEAALRDTLETERIEVLNCGVSGYTAQAERRRIDDYLAYEPDLLLEYNGVNDLWETLERQERRLGRWKSLLARSLFLRTRFSSWFLPDDVTLGELLDRQTIRPLGRMADAAQQEGVEVAFATFLRPDVESAGRSEWEFLWYDLHHGWPGQLVVPETYAGWIDLYNQRLRALCRKRGLLCVDVAARFSGRVGAFRDVCHLRDEGIEEKVDALLTPEFLAYLQADLESSGAGSRLGPDAHTDTDTDSDGAPEPGPDSN
ncbi:MAG: GDSL-type esterase/lipase family protein [Candidatus Eisenbacteria bacterium]